MALINVDFSKIVPVDYRQSLSATFGTGVYKNANSFSHSPDGAFV